jgi:hypothetical protein
MGEEKHSILPPSDAGIWSNCPASISLRRSLPERPQSTVAADTGKKAHAVGAEAIASWGKKSLGEFADTLGPYVSEILEIRKSVLANELACGIERRVDCPDVHPECFGTVDQWLIANNILYVYDLKYGRVPVHAYGNKQLLIYASGIMRILPATIEIKAIHFSIFQPNDYLSKTHWKRWNIRAVDLRSHIEPIRAAAVNALSNDPLFSAGRHCRYCAARYNCREFARTVGEYSEPAGVETITLEQSAEARGLELTALLKALDLITYRIDAIRDDAFRGVLVPAGFAVQPGPGSTIWKPGDLEKVKQLAAVYGVEVQKDALITPKQAIDAGLPAEVVKPFTEKKPGQNALRKIDLEEWKEIFKCQENF